MGLKHIIWILVGAIIAGLVLHFLGLPTPLEFMVIFLKAFGVLA